MEIIIWWIYEHFKGHLIEIITLAEHTETKEELVVYKHIWGTNFSSEENKVRVRPKEMFLEEVTKDGNSFPRFKLVKTP